MILQEILNCRIVPFDIDDDKLVSLFSFYLHKAPTIDSSCSGVIPACGQDAIWTSFITNLSLNKNDYHIYSSGSYVTDKNLENYDLEMTSIINRKCKRFVGYKKEGENTELECLLRHLRNSIAHGNVYVLNKSNRKYIVFDDFNTKKHLTARILLGQTDLNVLKKLLEQK